MGDQKGFAGWERGQGHAWGGLADTHPAVPGVLQALEAVNAQLRELYPDSEELFDIVLMTNNHAQVGVRLINSINHYGEMGAKLSLVAFGWCHCLAPREGDVFSRFSRFSRIFWGSSRSWLVARGSGC